MPAFEIRSALASDEDELLELAHHLNTVNLPYSREAVRLGTIVITAIEANETCDASVFDPANLAEGIGYPPDEIFAARRAAYAISLAQRS